MRKINELNTYNYFRLTQIGKLRPQSNWENRVERRILLLSLTPCMNYNKLTRGRLRFLARYHYSNVRWTLLHLKVKKNGFKLMEIY